MASNTLIGQILEKLPSKDKDFRYMATSDLQSELSKETFKIDKATEKKLCTAVLQQLQDESGEISALAVKCLGLLVRKVDQSNVEMMVTALGDKVTSGKGSQEKEIAGLGLRAVVADLRNGPVAVNLANKLTPSLLTGLTSQDPETVNSCLDLLSDLAAKFGMLMEGEHARIQGVLLELLKANKATHRKRSINCLASVAPYFSQGILAETVGPILGSLAAKSGSSATKLTYIQAIGSLSRATGWRIGGYLGQAVPSIIQHCRSAGEGDDELQEACLQALEAFVSRSPQPAQEHVPAIFDLILHCMTYDPNYADDMEEDEEEEPKDDDLSEEVYSDDEDTSWKVRRAATKTLAAIIAAYPNLLPELYPSACQALTARFKEREETVKVDTFHTLVSLIAQVGELGKQGGAVSGPAAQLRTDVPAILKAASRQLGNKSVKTRAGVFQVVKELVAVDPDPVTRDIDQLMPGIISALTDQSSSTSALKIQALQFLGLALHRASQEVWHHQIGKLAPPVFLAVADRYYKVSAEALRVCEELVHSIRPNPALPLQPALQQLVEPLFSALQDRLAAQDQDQEVKEAAISCAGTAIAGLGDVTNGAYLAQIKILLERLHNDVTRLPAVKAFNKIARSPLGLSLAPHVQPLLAELISFLRKANRQLRQASLATLEAVLQHKESAGCVPVEEVVGAVSQLISDSDLLLTNASLAVATSLLRCHPSSAPAVAQALLPPALHLSQSSLLQGSALESLKAFFTQLLQSQQSTVSFDTLLTSLLAAGNAEDLGKAAQLNLAQCIAAICRSSGPDMTNKTVQSLLTTLQAKKGPASAKHLALLSMGEVGRTTDLSAFPGLQKALTSALASKSDELKGAASLALGAVAVGNLQAYFPFILQQIEEQAANPKDQYLLLRALNEVIVSLDTDHLPAEYQAQALGVLLKHCESEEECRNAVAECLGHLALLSPGGVVPEIRKQAGSTSPAMRTTVVASVKYAIVDTPHAIDAHLVSFLPTFLERLNDPDRHVRKAAVQLLSIAAHNKVELVREGLPGVLASLYKQTEQDPSMIRVVELGPFQHKIDDGLELRKAAFECMDVLLETAADRLSLPEFIKHLQLGLDDHYDVKMPCHLLLSKLAGKAGGHVLAALDTICRPLEKTLTTKLKTDAVKQEVDRNEDMIRSCLRAVQSCTQIPDAETSAGFKGFMDRIVLQPPIGPKFAAVREERAEAEGKTIS